MKSHLVLSREDLLRHVGNISQLAGATRYYLADGRGFGTECVSVRTGSGFEYTVMPGRGMDIGWCGYKGIPISYISKVGVSSPAYFSGVKDQWRQCFPGGMLSTCGLSNVGSFCEDSNIGIGVQDFGQHGRISNQCAYNVCVSENWESDVFSISVTGTVREAQLRAENFTLKRSVTSTMGSNCFILEDEITNEDFIDRPLMFLYHMNFGFPIIGTHSQILFGSHELITGIDGSCSHTNEISLISEPDKGICEKMFFFRAGDSSPVSCVAIFNRSMNLMAYIKYSSNSMPFLTEWKMMGESDYVIGLETGNCIPKGRKYHRLNNALPILQARSSVHNRIELGIVEDAEAIEDFISKENLTVKE